MEDNKHCQGCGCEDKLTETKGKFGHIFLLCSDCKAEQEYENIQRDNKWANNY